MDWRGLLTVILILIREEEGADFSSARSSSSYGALYGPQNAIDGKISKMHRDFFGSQMEDNPWLEVSMPEGFIKGVEIVTRWGCCADRVKNIEFRAGRESVPRRFKGRLTSNTKVATFVGPADANFQTYRVDFNHNVLAKFVTLQRIGTGVYLEINEIRMITLLEDFSSARSSSSYGYGAIYGPLKAIDGKISKTNYNFFGSHMEDNPWLEVSMPEGYIKGVEIVTRCCCCADRVKNIEFRAGMDSVPNGFKGRLTFNTKVATFVGPANANLQTYRVDFDEMVLAKYVTLQRIGTGVSLEINEIRMIKGSAPCICGKLQSLSKRILEGSDTTANKYPWMALLWPLKVCRSTCGGTLLNNQWVLSAARCHDDILNPAQLQVQLGQHDLLEDSTKVLIIPAKEIILHPNYDNNWMRKRVANYDFSLVKLSTKVDFLTTPHVRPICLPPSGQTFINRQAVVAGWGLISEKDCASKLRE